MPEKRSRITSGWKRTGEDFLSADPTQDSAVAAVVSKLATPPAGFEQTEDKVTEFYKEHASHVNEDAKMRFAPRSVKRTRKVSSPDDAVPAPIPQSQASSLETAHATQV